MSSVVPIRQTIVRAFRNIVFGLYLLGLLALLTRRVLGHLD